MKMAATNPWARDDPRSRRYPVALGGIKAFVTRNQLVRLCLRALIPDGELRG